ncbi:glucose-1-phosphate adenylyltransferase [uncultured archaeon]|nr:glucose-1-phosphate adenylyltransferase [uncultured archaeon]HKJ96992.1 nucleotidyltransferase family protein [Thermoplasmataceae archaeon]
MIGAILAGGYGKRLKPITDAVPKPLIRIKDDYTIMDRQLFDFRNMGVRDVYILSGYLGDKIEERYGKESKGLRFHYLREDKPLGTLFSLRGLLNEISDEDIVLRNGDTITDMNFNRFVEFAVNSPYGLVMFISRMKSPFGVVETLGEQIVNFVEKPYLDYYINSGLYYIKKDVFPHFFKEYLNKDIETTVFPQIANLKMAGAYREETMWIGVDSEKDLEIIRKEYSNREDEEWGYTKTIFSQNGKEIKEYFVKSGEKAEIKIGNQSVLRMLKGSGLLETPENTKLNEDDVFSLSNNVTLKALENVSAEVITL